MIQDVFRGPYGAQVPSQYEPPAVSSNAGQSAMDPPKTVRITDESLAVVQPDVFASRLSREREMYSPQAGWRTAYMAGVRSWDSFQAVNRLVNRPSFDGGTPIKNLHEYYNALGMGLSEREREFLDSLPNTDKAKAFGVEVIENERRDAGIFAQQPFVATAAGMVSPEMLVIPPALRVGAAFRVSSAAGRAVSAVGTAAIAGGLAAGREGTVTTGEIAISAITAGIIGTLAYKPGKGLVRAAPTGLPVAKGEAAIAALRRSDDVAVQRRLVQEAKYVDEIIPARAAVYEDVVIPATPEVKGVPARPAVFKDVVQTVRALDTSKPKYGYQSKSFGVSFENPVDKAAYTLAGKGKSARHDDIMAWATKATGATAAELVQRGQAIRQELKASAKGAADGRELTVRAGPIQAKAERVEVSPATPAIEAATAMPERVERVLKSEATQERVERRLVQEAVYEDIPAPLRPGAVNTSSAEVAEAVEQVLEMDAKRVGIAEKMMFNMQKSMASYGPVGKKIANLLYDNNSDLSKHSMESLREGNINKLSEPQVVFESQLRDAVANQGYGTAAFVNPATVTDAYRAQRAVEKEVAMEMWRRDQASWDGAVPASAASEEVTAMANTLDTLAKDALGMMQRNGVDGAETLTERSGYFSRVWDSISMENTKARLVQSGMTPDAAHKVLVKLVQDGLQRANAMADDTARVVAQAVVRRTLDKGAFEESFSNFHSIREVLIETGSTLKEAESVVNALRARVDKDGRAAYLKGRMDLDYTVSTQVGTETIALTDLLDARVSDITDRYVKQVGTNSAGAALGLRKASDFTALRKELEMSLPAGSKDRKAALELFDNTIAHFRGEPAGAALNDTFRLWSAYGRSITLAWSGLWQSIDFSNAMGEFGMRATLKHAALEFPGFKQLLQSADVKDARALNNVLAEHSVASMRLRPLMARFEDGFEVNTMNRLHLVSQSVGQLVPYFNGMKYMHRYQAKVVGNLILDRLEMAAKGDSRARAAVAKYGLEAPVMDRLAVEINKHGFKVDAWDSAVWDAVRPATAKMMDTAVLKARLGDMPEFAAFDSVGKFIFMYKSFALASHNKKFAGTLARDGAGALAMLIAYQFPLAALAVQAQSVATGKGTLSEEELLMKALGQVGALGALGEILKVITGDTTAIGAAALIPGDRAIKAANNLASGDVEGTARAASLMIPLFSVMPVYRAVEASTKD